MLVDVDGIDHVAHMALTERVDDLQPFAQLAPRAGADAVFAQEFGSPGRRLDVAEVVETPHEGSAYLCRGRRW